MNHLALVYLLLIWHRKFRDLSGRIDFMRLFLCFLGFFYLCLGAGMHIFYIFMSQYLIDVFRHVNYVRGAHYPQDQRFLDLCDEVRSWIYVKFTTCRILIETSSSRSINENLKAGNLHVLYI